MEWTDYGARKYDNQIGRWHNLDIIADAYSSYSPYSYVLNNPISNLDIKGQWTVSRHNKMTLRALSNVDIGGEQAKLIAHYSSVYADNPGNLIHFNNIPQNSEADQVRYRKDINYSRTENSQEPDWSPGKGYNYNTWHSMRSTDGKEAHD